MYAGLPGSTRVYVDILLGGTELVKSPVFSNGKRAFISWSAPDPQIGKVVFG